MCRASGTSGHDADRRRDVCRRSLQFGSARECSPRKPIDPPLLNRVIIDELRAQRQLPPRLTYGTTSTSCRARLSLLIGTGCPLRRLVLIEAVVERLQADAEDVRGLRLVFLSIRAASRESAGVRPRLSSSPRER